MGVFAFRLDVHEQQIFLLVASGVVAIESDLLFDHSSESLIM